MNLQSIWWKLAAEQPQKVFEQLQKPRDDAIIGSQTDTMNLEYLAFSYLCLWVQDCWFAFFFLVYFIAGLLFFRRLLSAISCLNFNTMLSTALVANQFNIHVSNTLINLSA